MQSEPIPDEMMREAENTWSLAFTKGGDPVAMIARALLARDRRAAEIVRNLGPASQDMTSTMICVALDAAAAAILTYKEADNG